MAVRVAVASAMPEVVAGMGPTVNMAAAMGTATIIFVEHHIGQSVTVMSGVPGH